MRSPGVTLGIAVLSVCGLAWAPASSPKPDRRAARSEAQGSFDALKGLAGTWTGRVATDPRNPDIEGAIEVTIRVASRGNVLVHEIAPGGVPEPTLIYLEDDHLTLVHYCEAGNRPRMAARPSHDAKAIAFEFVDLSGPESPAYLHNFVFTPVAPDRHTEDWTFTLPGGTPLRAHFDLQRAKATVPSSGGV